MKKFLPILLLATIGLMVQTVLGSDSAGGDPVQSIWIELSPGTYSSWNDSPIWTGSEVVYQIKTPGEYHLSGAINYRAYFEIDPNSTTPTLTPTPPTIIPTITTIPYSAIFANDQDASDEFDVIIYLENFSISAFVGGCFIINGFSVKIVLIGENTLETTVFNEDVSSIFIMSSGSLTISSENGGSLNLLGKIQCDGTLTIDDGTITVNPQWYTCGIEGSGDLVVNGGSVTATGSASESYPEAGISVGSVTVNGGSVNATCGGNPVTGISSDSVIVTGGNVTANGTTGITADSVTITGGNVSATGTSAAGIASGSVTITDGVVNANGSEAGIDSESIVVDGGSVEASSESGSAYSSTPKNSSTQTVYCVTLPGAASTNNLTSSSGTFTYTVTQPSGYSYSYTGSGHEGTDDLYFYLPDGTYEITGSDAASGRWFAGTVNGAATTFEALSSRPLNAEVIWSGDADLDTLNVASGQTIELKPTDSITYSTQWAAGYDRKITLFAQENASGISGMASVFSAGTPYTILDTEGDADGSYVWNYTSIDPTVLPRNSTYTLYYSITDSATGTEFTPAGGYNSLSTFTILPEPGMFLGLLILTAITFRKR